MFVSVDDQGGPPQATESPSAGDDPVVAAVRAIRRVVIAQSDAGELDRVGKLLRQVKGFVDVGIAAVARRADELHEAGRGAPSDEVLARSGRMSRRDAQRLGRRSRALADAPRMSNDLAAGSISGAHADALANAAGRLPEDKRGELFAMDDVLSARARESSPERFARYVGDLARQIAGDDGEAEFVSQRRSTTARYWVDQATGMYIVHAELDAELGNRVFGALDRETDRLWQAQSSEEGSELAEPLAQVGVLPELAKDRGHLAAFAMVGLIAGQRTDESSSVDPDAPVAGSGSESGAGSYGSASAARGSAPSSESTARRTPDLRPAEVEVSVLIDFETLVRGMHDRSVSEWGDGTAAPVSTIRRLACNATIVPVVLNGKGAVLDLGRGQRLASRDQRRALRSMYRTCAWAGCSVAFGRCEVHHVDPWNSSRWGGPTDLGNLLPLCSLHHHLVHEGRWRIVLDASRMLSITRPDGVLHARVRPGLRSDAPPGTGSGTASDGGSGCVSRPRQASPAARSPGPAP